MFRSSVLSLMVLLASPVAVTVVYPCMAGQPGIKKQTAAVPQAHMTDP